MHPHAKSAGYTLSPCARQGSVKHPQCRSSPDTSVLQQKSNVTGALPSGFDLSLESHVVLAQLACKRADHLAC